jgi:hypothetical protein
LTIFFGGDACTLLVVAVVLLVLVAVFTDLLSVCTATFLSLTGSPVGSLVPSLGGKPFSLFDLGGGGDG